MTKLFSKIFWKKKKRQLDTITWLSKNRWRISSTFKNVRTQHRMVKKNSKESKISLEHQLACKSDSITLTRTVSMKTQKHNVIGMLYSMACYYQFVSSLWNEHTEQRAHIGWIPCSFRASIMRSHLMLWRHYFTNVSNRKRNEKYPTTSRRFT